MAVGPDAAERAILGLLAERAPGATICPSEAARALGGDDGFRALMPLVREAAGGLVARGTIDVTQRGEVVDLASARGPIRLRLRRAQARREQTGQAFGPCLAISAAARWSCSLSGAAAGSPLPPTAAQVDGENWYLPR